LIDGLDIKDVGLRLLRSKITVIPQEPVLFSGTIRGNLDPFGRYTDRKLTKVLRQVGLMSNTRNALGAVKTLEDIVLEDGKNFSVGQRQLIAFARAILSETNILLVSL